MTRMPRCGCERRDEHRPDCAMDDSRARRWPLAALLLSIALGAKRKPVAVDWRRFIDLLRKGELHDRGWRVGLLMGEVIS